MRAPVRPAALAVVLGVILAGLPWSAHAAPAGWASYTGVADGAAIRTTVTQAAEGFPTARIVSDSARGSGTGVFTSGSTTTIGASTPPGAIYGSSAGADYLGLRPQSASQTSSPPSETTVTFERPTPATGWTFVLGDIDADRVTVEATDADGEPLTPAQLGFRGAFNYRGQADLPVWDVGTATLTGNGANTNGASGWFEPTVPVSALTLTFDRLVGSPTYQLWFSSLAYDLSGTVTAPAGYDPSGTTVELLDADGEPLARTEVDDDGSYAFPGRATYDDHQVRVIPPLGLRVVGADTRAVDLSEDDRVVDVELEVAPTGTAGGTVTDAADDPVADAVITVTGPEGIREEIVTGADGTWELADLPPAEYTATLTPPAGLEADGSDELTFTIDEDGTDVDELDFSVVDLGVDVSGTLTDADGDPLAGVEITVAGEDREETVTTDDDGRWTVPELGVGDYEADVDLPDDLRLEGTNPRPFTVEADGTVTGDLSFTAVPVAAPTPTASGSASSTPTSTGTPTAGTPSTSTPSTGSPSTTVPTASTSRPTTTSAGPSVTSGAAGNGSGTGGSSGPGLAATGGPEIVLPAAAGLLLVLAGTVLLLRPRRVPVRARRR